ncbi:MAG TPA: outer membrane lipoprotein-sorting protein [Salinimicrobium sp.]|nr:outer membrane lipoprotein-sorting protein [Salinimicrobium sp.]
MKSIKLIQSFVILFFCVFSFGQTADEIINSYLEKTGGLENWRALEATKMTAETTNEGVVIPINIYSTKDGKQAVKITYSGEEITQLAYDGKELWATNAEMLPQKADKESTENMEKSKNDFPNPFIDYKEKGYYVDFLGTEIIDGKEAYKIMLIQEPTMYEGQKNDNISYHYFDTKSYFPILVETKIPGEPINGQYISSEMKNYKKVKGLYFPFLLIENGNELKITEIEINPEIKDEVFAFPKD